MFWSNLYARENVGDVCISWINLVICIKKWLDAAKVFTFQFIASLGRIEYLWYCHLVKEMMVMFFHDSAIGTQRHVKLLHTILC
jgi:hypothetical protein